MLPIYALVLIMLLLNIWVWFFPKTFIKYINLGKGAKIESVIPSLKEIWEHVDHPIYIWFPRFIFSIGLMISIVIMYYIAR